MVHWWPVAFVYMPAAAVAAITSTASWRFRRLTPAASSLAVVMAPLVVWSGVSALAEIFPDHRVLFVPYVIPSAAASCAAYVALARCTADRGWRPTRRWTLLMAAQPGLMLVAAITNPWHHALVALDDNGVKQLQWLFWVHTVYCYLALTAGTVIMWRARGRGADLYRRQIDIMLLAGFAAAAGNIVTLVMARSGNHIDFSVIGFAITGVIDCWAILRQGLFRIVPVARDVVVDTLPDSVLVTDAQGRLVDMNAAANRLLRAALPHAPADLLGLEIARLVPDLFGILELKDGEYHVMVGDHPIDVDVRVSPLTDTRHRSPIGHVVVVRDVTAPNQRRRQLALANQRLVQQVETIEALRAELFEQATRDELTGLRNRRYLMDLLNEQVPKALEQDQPLSVLMIDLDYFKRINDQFGHAVGDRMLARAGEVLRREMRTDSATVARYGGEEFVAVLPGVPVRSAVRLAERLRIRFSETSVQSRGGRVATTMSIGVAELMPDNDVDGLLERADRALYEAKAGGRDRVIAADATLSADPDVTPELIIRSGPA